MQDPLTLLAVDTALGACSVAVPRDGAILAHHAEPMARGHAEALAPMVQQAMQDAGIAFGDLDRLAVTVGPGTFTGQRVGLAFMRGLRLALKTPLTGVTTLAAMAAATQASRAAAIHDARRGEAYLLLWQDGRTVLEPMVAAFDDVLARVQAFGPCALAGTGAAEALARLGEKFTLSEIRQPDALWVARLASAQPASADIPGPLYLRAPDAKLPASRA